MQRLGDANYVDHRLFLVQHAPELLDVAGWEELPYRDFLIWVYDRHPEIARVVIDNFIGYGRKAEADEEERRWAKQEQMKKDGVIFDPHIRGSLPEASMTFETLLLRELYPAVQEAHGVVQRWCGRGGAAMVVLAGPPGVGKTHLLSAAAHVLQEHQQEYLFLTDAQMVAELHSSMGRNQHGEALADVIGVQWLLWDDLGMAARGEFDRAELDQIINERWGLAAAGIRTLITTNLSEEHLSPRLASRLMDRERVLVHEIKAADYRRERSAG